MIIKEIKTREETNKNGTKPNNTRQKMKNKRPETASGFP